MLKIACGVNGPTVMDGKESTPRETELTLALREITALGTIAKTRGHKDVSKFLEQLKDFVSESAEEVASAYLKEALKQSFAELTAEIGSKVGGLALKHFTVVLLSIFFEHTDRSLKSTQKWMFLSSLHSGTSNALQALNAACASPEDFALRNHLLNASITQLNEAYEMSKRDPRILLYVRLLQGLASEALGAHAFTRQYLSDCLAQFRERSAHFKAESEKSAEKTRAYADKAAKIRAEMAQDPSIRWTHEMPELRGDLEVKIETADEAIARFNDNSDGIQYIEDPNGPDWSASYCRDESTRYRTQMEFYEGLIRLAEGQSRESL